MKDRPSEVRRLLSISFKLCNSGKSLKLFELLNIIDGTSEPDENIGKWTEISIVDKTDEIAENAEMLHDELYSKYWDWKKIRPNKSWKLDNYEE